MRPLAALVRAAQGGTTASQLDDLALQAIQGGAAPGLVRQIMQRAGRTTFTGIEGSP
jgi:hypothetical protein